MVSSANKLELVFSSMFFKIPFANLTAFSKASSIAVSLVSFQLGVNVLIKVDTVDGATPLSALSISVTRDCKSLSKDIKPNSKNFLCTKPNDDIGTSSPLIVLYLSS